MKYKYILYPLFAILLFTAQNNAWAFSHCNPATPLSCGSTTWHGTLKSNNFNIANYNLSGCKGTLSSFNGNDSLFTINVGASPRDLSIVLAGLSDDLDLFVFKSCQENYGGFVFFDCQGNSLNQYSNKDSVFIPKATGTYYVIIDAYKAGITSGFTLKVDCQSPSVGGSCNTIKQLHCNDRVINRNDYYDYHATNLIDSHPECNGYVNSYKGYEVIYRLGGSYGALRNVTIDLNALSAYTDLDLFVYRKCNSIFDPWTGDWKPSFSDLINKCHYNQASPYGTESVWIDYIGPNEEVYIVVEGKQKGNSSSYHSGSFELSVSCGDICDQKITDIACNSSLESTTEYNKNLASYYLGDPSTHPGNNWGPEKTYKFIVEEITDIEIDLEVSSYADLNLYLLDGCGARFCIAYSKNIGSGKNEKIKYKLYPGTYYIVVEGYRGNSGKFKLSLTGCKCKNATEVFCDKPVKSTTHYSSNTFPQIKNHCFMNTSYPVLLPGKDRVFYFKAPETKEYTFRLKGLNSNLDMFVVSNCKDENSCLGFSTRSNNEDEDIVVKLIKYEEVYIIVDSKSSLLSSDFTLLVECTPPPPCISTKTTDTGIQIDLSVVNSQSCQVKNGVLKAYRIVNLANLTIDPSSEQIIPISGNNAEFFPLITGQHYQLCYTYTCGSQKFVCCVQVFVPFTLNCGNSFSSSTIGLPSNYDASKIDFCYSSASDFKGPDQLVKLVKSNASDVIRLTMFHTSSNLSLFILDKNLNPVRLPCKALNFNDTKAISNTSAIGEVFTDETNPLPAGIYFALVEGFSRDIASNYTLHLDCGLKCTNAIPLSCDIKLVNETNASSQNNQSTYQMGSEKFVGYTGGEKVYKIELAVAQSISVTLTGITGSGSQIDMDLFLLKDNCNSSSIIGKSVKKLMEESIQISLPAGTYYAVADGWNGAKAKFNIAYTGCTVPALASTNRSFELQENSDPLLISPNPFSEQFQLQFNAEKEGRAILELFDLSGRVLLSKNILINKGINQTHITGSEIGTASGMIYYQLSFGDRTYQGKLIRI